MAIETRIGAGLTAGLTLGAAAFANTGFVSADETRAIVAEMLADAESRSSLVANSNPNTDLTVGGYFQFRYIANFRDDDNTDDDFESGFTFSRTRLVFKGTLHDNIDFLVLPAAGSNGDWNVLDIWAKFKSDDSKWSLQLGQFKLPFWREWLLTERHNHLVERSELTNVFSSIYAQGVQASYASDTYRANIAFSDGLRSLNSDFTDDFEADWAFTGRAEFLFGGSFKQHGDLSSLGNSEGSGLLGLALHFQGETDDFRGVDANSVFQYTIDYAYEGTNWNIFGAFVGRHIELGGGGETDDFGFLAQAGVFVDDNAELVARYNVLLPDDDSAGDDAFHTVAAGLNYYLHGHNAKFTFDVVYYINNTTDTQMTGFGPSNGIGLLSSPDDGQVALRSQFQIVF